MIDEYSKKYQTFLFSGDFNDWINEKYLPEFRNVVGLASLKIIIKKINLIKMIKS